MFNCSLSAKITHGLKGELIWTGGYREPEQQAPWDWKWADQSKWTGILLNTLKKCDPPYLRPSRINRNISTNQLSCRISDCFLLSHFWQSHIFEKKTVKSAHIIKLHYIIYSLFYKTLPKSSWQTHWILVIFYEMGQSVSLNLTELGL